MRRRLPQLLFLVFFVAGICRVASADQIGIGDLTYDQIATSDTEFDITNLTGVNAFPPDFPITTPVTITVTSLTVDFASGPSLVLPGSDFTVVDAQDDLDCTAAACNLSGDDITDSTLMGTLSPTTGLSGLPAGDTGIEADFSTTITPGCGTTYLDAGCDSAIINATGTSGGPAPTPEPGTVMLFGTGLIGLFFIGYRRLGKSAARDVEL